MSGCVVCTCTFRTFGTYGRWLFVDVCCVCGVWVGGGCGSTPEKEARERETRETIDRMKIDEVPSLARKARIAAHTHIKVRRARDEGGRGGNE